jgi:hypothetical protein
MADAIALEQAGMLRRVREEHEDASGAASSSR